LQKTPTFAKTPILRIFHKNADFRENANFCKNADFCKNANF
jgi:hypothetical protein